MEEFEGMLALGRAMRTQSAHRGALIQLEGDTAFMVNEPRSLTLKLKFNKRLGDGTFYAGEAISAARMVERRDQRVLFEWGERGKTRREFVPDKNPIQDKVEEALERYRCHVDDHVKIPTSVVNDLTKEILTTRINIKDNKVMTRQLRSDGTVELENETDLKRGLITIEHPDTEETTLFTADLYVMRGLVDELQIGFGGGGCPLSLLGRFNFGATFEGVAAHMIYEV